MATTVAELQAVVTADTSQAQGSLMSFSSLLGSSGPLVGGAIAVSAAVIAMGVASVHMAGDFQAGMTTLVTGAGEAQSNIKMVGDGILSLAQSTGTGTKQLTDGMYMIESAGFHGAAGLDVLKAAAQGAKVGNADLGVVADGVTTVLVDYAKSGINATQATNVLINSVANGKTHMQDLAASLSKVLPTASAVGVSLTDVTGAMSTMTGQGTPAANAATYLRQTLLALEAPGKKAKDTLASIGISGQMVNDGLKKSLPDTLQMITDALGKKFPVGSAQYVSALKDIAGGSKTMQGILQLTGDHMKTFQANTKSAADALANGKSKVLGWSDVTATLNFQIDRGKAILEALGITIGTKLLPVVSAVTTALGGALGGALDFVQSHGSLVGAVLVGIGAAVLAILVPALIALAGAAWAAVSPILIMAAPFIAVALAVGILAAGVKYAYDNFAPFRQAIATVVAGAQQLWSFLVASFTPAFKQVADVVRGQIMPALASLLPVFQQAVPLLQFLGAVVGGVLVVAFGLLVGVLNGVVQGFAGLIGGVARALGGVIQVVSGFVTFFLSLWTGMFNILKDIFTGNFGAIRGDVLKMLTGMAAGVVGIISGLWNVVAGLFQAAWGAISGIVGGFVQGVIGFFTHLYDAIVGHSIIPDLVRGIISWIQRIGEIIGIVAGFVAQVIGQFIAFEARGIAVMVGFISGLISTIRGGIGGAINAMGAIKDGILGALAGLGGMLSNLVHGAIDGMIGTIRGMAGAVGGAISGLLGGVHLPGFASGTDNAPGGLAVVGEHGPEVVALPAGARVFPHGQGPAFGGARASAVGGTSAPAAQPVYLNIHIAGTRVAQVLLPDMVDAIRRAAGVRNT